MMRATTSAPYKLSYSPKGEIGVENFPDPIPPSTSSEWRLVGFQVVQTTTLSGLFVWAWESPHKGTKKE